MEKIFKYLKGDRTIWVITLLLLGFSIVTVYSFVPILIRTQGGSPFSYLMKHAFYVFLGFGAMIWIHRVNPDNVQKLSKFLFFVALALLIFTFFFGVRVNDASRWIRIPYIGLTFQSSDFAKFALVIFVSRRLVTRSNDFYSWKNGFWVFAIPILLIAGLIAKDNFSTAALIFLITAILMFIANYPISRILSIIGIGLGAFGLLILVHVAAPSANILPRFDTWVNRFTRAYAEPSASVENMQAINAKLAIYNGGYTGVGVGQGELKLYTPEAYADFYYSSFVEEFGLISAVILVLLYLILFYRILKIGLRAKSHFETYAAIGIALIFISQALVNMFVSTGVMPVTGQIMPFLAMGGSAMIMSCLGLGFVQSIARKTEMEKDVNTIKPK
ncbi:MAG: FtsW/RodA/SpoVE family cell cycle protein [Brumimicrobium sp.]